MRYATFPLALLLMALLSAPALQAQVTTAHPITTVTQTPTSHAELQQQRVQMGDHLTRMDQDFRAYERNVGAIRDPQARATAQQRLDAMRAQREAFQTDFDALPDLEGDQAFQRQRDLRQQLYDMESSLFEARLAAAPTRTAYTQLTDTRLRNLGNRMDQYTTRLRDLPANQRAEAAYQMIQLRSRHDALDRRQRSMTRLGDTDFQSQRDAYTRDLTQYERDVLQAEGAIMHHHTAQGATPPVER